LDGSDRKKSLLSFRHYKRFIRLAEHFNEGAAHGVSNVTVCLCVCVMVCVCVCARARVCVCVCERERESPLWT
jgi:hypothetical protein